MKWYPAPRRCCDCEADVKQISSVRDVVRGNPPRSMRSQMVRHYRKRDNTHYWHWRYQKVVRI